MWQSSVEMGDSGGGWEKEKRCLEATKREDPVAAMDVAATRI